MSREMFETTEQPYKARIEDRAADALDLFDKISEVGLTVVDALAAKRILQWVIDGKARGGDKEFWDRRAEMMRGEMAVYAPAIMERTAK